MEELSNQLPAEKTPEEFLWEARALLRISGELRNLMLGESDPGKRQALDRLLVFLQARIDFAGDQRIFPWPDFSKNEDPATDHWAIQEAIRVAYEVKATASEEPIQVALGKVIEDFTQRSRVIAPR